MTDRFSGSFGIIAGMKAIPVLLDIIYRDTGLEFTAVVHETGDSWVICGLRDELGCGLMPGDVLAVAPAIREEMRASPRTVIIENLAEAPDRPAPLPGNRKLQCFIAAPILKAGGGFSGALCAFDFVPRRLDRPETRAMFETFAELIGFHLSAGEREAENEASLLTERKSSTLRDQFITVLGHDLRNPLTAILGGMEMLRKDPLTERAAQWADMVVASARRMAELLDVVMDFSRSRLAGGITVERATCDSLGAALAAMVAELRSSKRSVVFIQRIDVSGPVHCDLRRVLQLAANLLSNAVTHGDLDQPIRIEASTEGEWFELAVANGGPPIPAAVVETIFEPFARGAVQPSRQGLGLGLYISHQIALAHGGSLTAVSTVEETRFTFRMKRLGEKE